MGSVTPTELVRFHGKYLVKGECWVWTAATTRGRPVMTSERVVVGERGRTVQARALAYEHFVGSVDRYEIHPECGNRLCVRPEHLRLWPRGKGTKDAWARRRPERCKRGHSLADAYVTSDGRRDCRECGRERNRAWKRRQPKGSLYRKHPLLPKKTVVCPACGESREIKTTLESKLCRRCSQRKPRPLRKCVTCGSEFQPAHLRPVKFCSPRCHGIHMSRERGGDGNPAFRHGRRVGVHIPGWRLQAKGENACRNCGGRDRVQLHHAIPRGKWKGGVADLRNGLPLCHDCHFGWHWHKTTICRDVFTEEEWVFLSAAELTGQRVEAWLDDRYPARTLSSITVEED